jgi:uncharacterized protein YoxC
VFFREEGSQMNPSEIDSETIARALDDFFTAMALRTERNVRVAKRVTLMLRVGMISFALLAALMTAMIWAFTDRVRTITDVLGTMRSEFSKMADNMTEMHATLSRLELDMASFSVVTDEMHLMRSTLSTMNSDVDAMAGHINVMHVDVDLVTGNVAQMNQAFRLLTPSVAGIGASVNQGAGPMKTFNNFFPFSRMLP